MTKIFTVTPKPVPFLAFQFTKQTSINNLPDGFHADIRHPGTDSATLIRDRGGSHKLGTWFVNTGNKAVWRTVADSTMRKFYDFEGEVPPMYDRYNDPNTREAIWE